MDSIEIKSIYSALLLQAKLDKDARKKITALHQTLDAFNVVSYRTTCAEAVLRLETLIQPDTKIYLDESDLRIQQLLQMVEHFREVWRKVVQ